MKLVIVESPNKTKKIRELLGSGYEVHASVGHIRDLPEKAMGVESPDFKPQYELSSRSKPIVARLKKLVKEAEIVYIATDPDREGEAIAWHLEQELRPKKYRRIKFNAITKTAISEAIANAGEIDYQMVAAQEGRRVIDRIVGYMVSPVLSRLAGTGSPLSAGRVQSVALRIVVDHERAIADFVSSDYFEVKAIFPLGGGKETWSAKWQHQALQQALKQETTEHFTDGNFAKQFAEALTKNPHFRVAQVERKPASRKPPAPFTTSSLQQAASIKLQMGVDVTMKTAQSLFEAGLITYHRTDSPNLDEESAVAIREWLTANGHEVTATSHKWPSKGDAQEAHEAIRPTYIGQRSITEFAEGSNEARLYELIWLRAAASQMPAAQYDTTRVLLLSSVSVQGQSQPFLARGKVLVSPGWLALMEDDATEEKSDGEDDDSNGLPHLEPGMNLSAHQVKASDCKTKAPARLTIAALVKALENQGVGRPSTYASIMMNIKKRGYITEEKQKVFASELGMAVVDTLVGRFSFMELPFTRMMEGALDKIAAGEAAYKPVVAHQHKMLTEELGKLDLSQNSSDTSRFNAALGPVIHCPMCTDGIMRRRNGKLGYFWSCSGYPNCTASAPDIAIKGEAPKPDMDLVKKKVAKEDMPAQIYSDRDCPKCKAHKLVQRTSAKGVFWSCSGFPECRAAFNDDKGKPDL